MPEEECLRNDVEIPLIENPIQIDDASEHQISDELLHVDQVEQNLNPSRTPAALQPEDSRYMIDPAPHFGLATIELTQTSTDSSIMDPCVEDGDHSLKQEVFPQNGEATGKEHEPQPETLPGRSDPDSNPTNSTTKLNFSTASRVSHAAQQFKSSIAPGGKKKFSANYCTTAVHEEESR